jgi:hypothetical protein
MEHYCTLFDRGFLPQGIALHVSLQRHAGPCTLWVLCLDEETRAALTALSLGGMRLLSLTECETAELKQARADRSYGEYCWTLASHTFTFVFDRDPAVERLTYLDADVFFLGPPRGFFRELELSGKKILITDHAYAPEYAHYVSMAGRYCVQFVTFARDPEAMALLVAWQRQTRESCTSQRDTGAFGDQQYLDEWPVRYPHLVHVLEHRDRTLAPWNADDSARRQPAVGSEAVMFHFHGLRMLSARWIQWGVGYPLDEPATRRFYSLYQAEITAALALAVSRHAEFRPRYHSPGFLGLVRFLRHALRGRLYLRRYNVL